MSAPKQFKCADWGQVDEITDAQDREMFKPVQIEWLKPSIWEKGESAPIPSGASTNCVYALTRSHHRSKLKSTIVYIGLTQSINGRFANHPKAKQLSAMRGETCLSVGLVKFGKYWHAKNSKVALEQLEHLLIWSVWPEFNDQKTYTLPGMGVHQTRPWRIANTGYRFHGVMPRELVYPWMLVKLGRNRSSK